MLKKILITSVFILIGSISAFAQNGTANCPTDKKQVETKESISIGGVYSAESKTTECKDKDSGKNKDSGGGKSGGGGNSGGGRGGGGGGGNRGGGKKDN